MKQVTLIIVAMILWQGNVSDLGYEPGRIVVTDNNEMVAERQSIHIDATGEQTIFWEKAEGPSEKAVYKEALLQMSQGQNVKQKAKVNPIKILGELDRLLIH